MHPEARWYVAEHASDEEMVALECGSRDVNGTVRDLFPNARWVGVDIGDGPGVDVVADFADYTHPEPVDLVVSTEVLEHTCRWREIVASAARNLRDGGKVIITAASHGRAPHSAVDGGPDIGSEHYANIDPCELHTELARHFAKVHVQKNGSDVQATAVK